MNTPSFTIQAESGVDLIKKIDAYETLFGVLPAVSVRGRLLDTLGNVVDVHGAEHPVLVVGHAFCRVAINRVTPAVIVIANNKSATYIFSAPNSWSPQCECEVISDEVAT